jgi:hypothetical protein
MYLFNDFIIVFEYTVLNGTWLVNDELGRIRKEAINV